MAISKIDDESAIREGWARDTEDEIYMDGYNAFIQISTSDGTSGFQVQNDIGSVAFSSKSDGDGYFAKRLGVGTYFPQTDLEVIGKTRTDQLQVTEGVTDGYVLTTDVDGNATWQLSPSAENDKVKASSTDIVPGFLDEKLTTGTGVTLTKNNGAGNEALEISITPGLLDGYGSATLPTPGCCGQVLYSLDTSTFTPELPLTSINSGWLINKSGNLLVVG